jgi:hypothetical protein
LVLLVPGQGLGSGASRGLSSVLVKTKEDAGLGIPEVAVPPVTLERRYLVDPPRPRRHED